MTPRRKSFFPNNIINKMLILIIYYVGIFILVFSLLKVKNNEITYTDPGNNSIIMGFLILIGGIILFLLGFIITKLIIKHYSDTKL